MEAVLRLTQQQQAVLDTAQGQMTSLEQLGNTLKTLDGTLEKAVAGVVASSGVTAELTVCFRWGRYEAVTRNRAWQCHRDAEGAGASH